MPTRRRVDMEPSTLSRATSALRRGVTICLVRSGPTITSTLLAPRQWHDWDCGLVVWVCTADHLEDEEASGGGERHDTTTWAAFWEVAQWCGGNIQ